MRRVYSVPARLSSWNMQIYRAMTPANLPHKSQCVSACAVYPRHVHLDGLCGGGASRFLCRSRLARALSRRRGRRSFSRRFRCPSRHVGADGGEILNVALPMDSLPRSASGRLDDAGELLRLAADEAALLLLRKIRARDDGERDWPDLLAADLRRNPSLELRRWAHSHGLRGETLSRGFFALYGVTPARFRAEARARAAWQRIRSGEIPLAAIAAETGFSDQPHMTRAVLALTGRPPGAWRQLRSRRAKAARLACEA